VAVRSENQVPETTKTEKPKRRKPTDDWDVVLDVEVYGYNRNPKFIPTGEELRGTVRSTQLFTDRPAGPITQVGTIPGQRILVDLENWHVKIIDRMSLPENRQIDQALRDLARRSESIRIKPDWQYWPDVDLKLTNKDQWAKCLWYMRRMVDCGKLSQVEGQLPELKEILKIGKVRLNNYGRPTGDKSSPWNVIDEKYIEELDHLEEHELAEA
jgi:hypothetical protein